MKNYLSLLLLPIFLVGCLETPTKPEIPEEPEIFLSSVYKDNLVEADDLFHLRQTNEGIVLFINENLNLEYYSFQGELIYNNNKLKLNHIYSLVDGMFVSNLDLPKDANGFSRARFALASSDVESLKDLILLDGVIEKETMVCFTDIVYDEISYNRTFCLQLTK